jgi:hypothetical protein
MDDHVFRDGSQPALFGVEHLLHIVNALGVVVEELDGDLHGVAGMEFAQIGQMRFECEERRVGGLHIVGTQSDQIESLIAGTIEEDIVIGHVEMAIIVDPLIFDLLGAGNKRHLGLPWKFQLGL